jgi:hypothetical protein
MQRSAEPSGSVGVLRVAAGLVRFAFVLLATLFRLVRDSAGRPDPIELQPRILQHPDGAAEN